MNIILLGAPGSGKGTEASLIYKNYKIPSVSTGDIIRDNIKNKTKLGILSEGLINNGQLVPDDVVIELIKQRLKDDDVKNGCILDGFPRTVTQAKALDSFFNIDLVIFIDVDYNVIENRILSRRVCPNCKAVYNLTNYHKDICEKCGTKLVRRDDDNKDTIKKRYDVYLKNTEPLIEYYTNKGNLVKVDGNDGADVVFDKIKYLIERK